MFTSYYFPAWANVIYREGLTFTDLLLSFQEDRLKECIRSHFPKNSEVTRTKISQKCEIPWTTVNNHYDDIIEEDLGDGTKLVHGRVCYDAVIRDPPGEEPVAIEVETPEDNPPDDSWEDFALGAVTGGLIATSIALISFALRERGHSCSWASVPSGVSWLRVCTICGAEMISLNDQSAPIHFIPVNS